VPTYQYACKVCEHRFEAVQSFTEASLTECPECSGQLRKLYGSVGVVFKGSGFYRTDSRKESSSATSAKAEASSASSSSSSSEGKSESKSDSTSSSTSSTSSSASTSSSSSSGTTGKAAIAS
jgi:putative FmdB family regulatory protein